MEECKGQVNKVLKWAVLGLAIFSTCFVTAVIAIAPLRRKIPIYIISITVASSIIVTGLGVFLLFKQYTGSKRKCKVEREEAEKNATINERPRTVFLQPGEDVPENVIYLRYENLQDSEVSDSDDLVIKLHNNPNQKKYK